MNILCWNSNDAVWNHWGKVASTDMSLVRVTDLSEVQAALADPSVEFTYCFIYIEDNGFSAKVEQIVSLCETYPKQAFLVFPNQPSQMAALRLFAKGVKGQCSPYIGEDQLQLVLSVVASGEIWGGKAFIQKLISQSAMQGITDNSELDVLSEREKSVAQYIAEGLSNKQIAQRMDITERTVKAHLTTIFKKTHTRDRLSLALLVQNSHLVH